MLLTLPSIQSLSMQNAGQLYHTLTTFTPFSVRCANPRGSGMYPNTLWVGAATSGVRTRDLPSTNRAPSLPLLLPPLPPPLLLLFPQLLLCRHHHHHDHHRCCFCFFAATTTITTAAAPLPPLLLLLLPLTSDIQLVKLETYSKMHK